MTSRDFVYWLQGYFEIMDPSATTQFPLGPAQTQCIREHLALVFKHEIAPPKPPEVKVVPPYHNEPLGTTSRDQWQRLMQGATTQTFDPVTGTWSVC
jgi:hypothetical protein